MLSLFLGVFMHKLWMIVSCVLNICMKFSRVILVKANTMMPMDQFHYLTFHAF